MSNKNCSVEICVNGKPVRKFSHEGKVFVESRKEQEYSIKVKNNNSERVLVIGSIDGINILDGQAAGKSNAGYVINGFQSYEIKGFRKSSDAVNAFKFNSKDKSYASKSEVTGGDTSNCGVIAVVIYSEKEKPKPEVIYRDRIIKEKEIIDHPYPVWPTYPNHPWHHPYVWCGTTTTDFSNGYNGNITHSINNAGDAPQASFSCSTSSLGSNQIISNGMNLNCASQSVEEHKTNFDMGTEWSKNEINDQVVDTEFETGKKLTTFVIYYASYEALINMGVELEKVTKVSFPDPFPTKFCKPPVD